MSEKPGGKDEKEQVDTVSVCVYLFFFAELRAQRKIETNSQISSVTTTTPAAVSTANRDVACCISCW